MTDDGLHLGPEELEAVPAGGLRFVERHVGVAQRIDRCAARSATAMPTLAVTTTGVGARRRATNG